MVLSGQVGLYWPELMTARLLAICLPALRGGGLGRRKCRFVKSVLVMVLP